MDDGKRKELQKLVVWAINCCVKSLNFKGFHPVESFCQSGNTQLKKSFAPSGLSLNENSNIVESDAYSTTFIAGPSVLLSNTIWDVLPTPLFTIVILPERNAPLVLAYEP